MQARHLTMAIMIVMNMLAPHQSACQKVEWSGRPPLPGDVARFFQGNISANNPVARYNVPILQIMGEKPLVDTVGPQAAQVFRMVVLTRPQGIPAVVRISIGPNGAGEIVGKMSESARAAGVLRVNRIVHLSHTDVDEFLKLLADSGFWSMSVFEPIDVHHVVMGETSWMFEGAKDGSYHVVCRGASSLTPLRKIVTYLTDVSKLELPSPTMRPENGG